MPTRAINFLFILIMMAQQFVPGDPLYLFERWQANLRILDVT